ncbi:3-phosphoshikimate 1-carboxyvinyltransferase [Plasmopara halstedii]|uniref:Pentafunctional AROM polypeptide n=1 Tax=Plasmopara halstedii TaxID=4781 RepID=A0A0P1A7D9_PLAHL|nr:3-phosphoshikimate 1-carboxyvinyltransferase [Plasmopara halstedii]CEG36095.1 3-phosphoshikimate 1-carboxyvinyltransferase [Plasmopara halstedii]|eukprot:XP_024572464.1 3-phosphoshikimate 1-carboxyvinyltransferase [Plasmopara halstedii]
MQQIIVPCGSYDIVLGLSLLQSGYVAEDLLKRLPITSTFVILSDENVGPLYAEPLRAQLAELLQAQDNTVRRVLLYTMPAGEASKCREMKTRIEDEVLFPNRCHRDTCIVAVGGGVVGDLAGYVAATYMRGIPFVQIPTSLLACVDSSIGGKTGIDVEAGKNLLGAFHMPQRVYIDLNVLHTLPKRELINGMAEVIKSGAIFNAELFELLENSTETILSLSNMDILQRVVALTVQVKATVVTEDTKEMGLRAILNFGHSIGHGIEALLQPEYLHGECISIGCIKEAEIARGMGLCTSATVGRLRRCLSAYGLSIQVPNSVAARDVLLKMEVDKKNSQGMKKIILLEKIGKVLANPYARPVKDYQIELVLEKQVRMVPGFKASGSIRVPGSKSISNRVLLMAALGKGLCRITGLLHSDDTQVMMNALQKVGAKFSWENNGAVLVVEGTAGNFVTVPDGEEIYLSNAGTAARFLTTAMTLVPSRNDGRVVVTGNYRMKERPIAPLVDALRGNGCEMTYLESEGCPPLAIRGTGLRGGTVRLAAKVSSQYVSSVLISAPYATEPLVLELEEKEPTSLPYIRMTTQLMQQFGISVETLATNRYRVPCGAYENPKEVSVEVDASSASYPLAFAAITGGQVTVEALGDTSLQGDAGFHKLLRSMGCTTAQSAYSTTVTGPQNGLPLKAVEINMETMTDAFMTAVVLAAVADGTTKITGIANQRVKECNRIEVMVTELRKIGVECGELPDGIWIKGTAGKTDHLKKASIACHNDHRIAMSFAVLGSVVDNVVITDKECTDKTYPEFWDHVQMHLGLQVMPVVEGKHCMTDPDTSIPSVFLIGMRGAGKSSLAKAAAATLHLDLLDTDKMLEEELGESIANFVARHNHTWEVFREKQKNLMLRLIANPPSSTIISCGGGIVETPEIVDALQNYPYVVHVHRDITDVLAYLDSKEESHRPSLGDSHANVWKRREPLYLRCATFEFVVNTGDVDFSRINRDFVRFLSVITPGLSTSFDFRSSCCSDTFFLSLTFPDMNDARSIINDISKGADALELRVDLLKYPTDTKYVAAQVALIRALSTLPIIFTVRSRGQGGAFPDGKENEKKMFELLQLGVRLGCEFVDMETCWSHKAREQFLLHRHRSAIISSFHAVQKPMSEAEIKAIFRTCYSQGRVQIVKVVAKAYSADDALMVDRIARDFALAWRQHMPIISLCTTNAGKLTRVLNCTLTPVTHPLLPAAAAPGQLSIEEIMTLRKQLGMLPAREFFLFGSPIQKSPSPAMHNAGFESNSLASLFTYGLHETTDVLEIVKRMQVPHTSFGGGSVTIPLKVDIMEHLNKLTPAAQAIGAVNTIIRQEYNGSPYWIGDNTDWVGILRPISKRLDFLKKPASELTALVVGAGGTSMAASYAMRHLGVAKLFIYNRTLEKAQLVAARFDAEALSELTKETLAHADVVIGTIPAQAGFQLPEYLMAPRGDGSKIVVLDAAYLPPITPMLAHAHESGSALCIQGYEMLYEQGIEQFRRWHKATQVWPINEEAMKEACRQHIPVTERLSDA